MLILEFSHVNNPVIGQFYDRFSFDVIPRIGQMVASDADSYQYLVESIRRFPKQVEYLFVRLSSVNYVVTIICLL